MAPCNGTTYSSKVGRHPPPTAHYNGTLQWHPAMAPRPLPQSWSSPSPPTIAHYNGTLRWHSNGTTSFAPCSGTLVPRPIRQSGSSLSPPIGSKNLPYSYRYLGNHLAWQGYVELLRKNRYMCRKKASLIISRQAAHSFSPWLGYGLDFWARGLRPKVLESSHGDRILFKNPDSKNLVFDQMVNLYVNKFHCDKWVWKSNDPPYL